MWEIFEAYGWLRVACLLTGAAVLVGALSFALICLAAWTLSALSRLWRAWQSRRWLRSLERSLPTSPGKPPSERPSPSPGQRRSSGSFPL